MKLDYLINDNVATKLYLRSITQQMKTFIKISNFFKTKNLNLLKNLKIT